jgi:endonuclease/exonuclease/phosphatase family metal-dependent hydrolase
VYGPAQTPQKEQFLTKLVHMTSHERLPILLGGDFNILMHAYEKNKENFDSRWPFLFNCVIDGLNLRELELSGRRYTWVNLLPNPTYEKLDRVLVSTEWELNHPLSTVVALPREISDHTPLIIDSGQPSSSNNAPLFKFELVWLLRDGFMEMVKDVWNSVHDEVLAVEN